MTQDKLGHPDGCTPIWMAAREGQLEIARQGDLSAGRSFLVDHPINSLSLSLYIYKAL